MASELLRYATADALALVERSAVSAPASAIDEALLDPSNAGIADAKPPSLTNGVTATTPSGGDFQTDVGLVLAHISGGAPTKPVILVSLATAIRLADLRDLEAAGVRVIITPAAGDRVIAIDADGVVYSDDGGALKIGAPDVEMVDAVTEPQTASVVMVSTWQRNLKVVRAERWVNWAKRPDAVAYLELP